MPDASMCQGHVNGRVVTGTNLCPELFNTLLDQSSEVMDEAGTSDNNDSVDLKNAILALISDNAPSPTWLNGGTAVVSGGGATVPTSVDCSGIGLPAGTKAVFLVVTKHFVGGYYIPDVYLRESSTKAAVLRLSSHDPANAHADERTFAMVTLDAAQTFDYYKSGQGTVTLEVIGHI